MRNPHLREARWQWRHWTGKRYGLASRCPLGLEPPVQGSHVTALRVLILPYSSRTGLRKLLNYLYNRYKLPIYMTENVRLSLHMCAVSLSAPG
jgi:hypothetical protein